MVVEGITIPNQNKIIHTHQIQINGSLVDEQIIQSKEYFEALRIDEISDNLVYIGYADIGTLDGAPDWAIKRLQKTGVVTSVQWADGNQNYDNIWDDRASLTYS